MLLPVAGKLGKCRKDEYEAKVSKDGIRCRRRLTPSLYTYRLVLDDGTAPNPYNVTTLTICKPVIRKCAQVGDIIAGVDQQRKISFVMVVTEKLTLAEYRDRPNTQLQLQVKVPASDVDQPLRRFGDAIYDVMSKLTKICQIGLLTLMQIWIAL